MRRGSRAGVALAACVVCILRWLPSCSATALPGTSYGQFAVNGTPTSNSCGRGIEAPNPWVFHVEIARDGDTVYWSFQDGRPALQATVDGSGVNATGSNGTTADLSGFDAGVSTCLVERTDAYTFVLGGEPTPSVVTSKFAYTFAAMSGSDCARQLASAGGPFDVLPCTVSYDLTATREK